MTILESPIITTVKTCGRTFNVSVTKLETVSRTQPTGDYLPSGRYIPATARDWNEYQGHARMYFWQDGETVLDHLVNRRFEPHRIYRAVMPSILAALGVHYETASWSQHAGCTMCPCSPGFILRDAVRQSETGPFDAFVTVKIEEVSS